MGHGTAVSVVIDASISPPSRATGRVTALPCPGSPANILVGSRHCRVRGHRRIQPSPFRTIGRDIGMAVSGVVEESTSYRLGRSVGSRHGRVRRHRRITFPPFRAIGRVTARPCPGSSMNPSPHRLGRSVGSRHCRVRGGRGIHLLPFRETRRDIGIAVSVGHRGIIPLPPRENRRDIGTAVSVVVEASISSPFRAIGRVTAPPCPWSSRHPPPAV